jgi:hypothetical protein
MKHKCPACEEEYDLDRIIGLSCGHFYCFECYSEYLKIKITEGNAERITFPDLNANTFWGRRLSLRSLTGTCIENIFTSLRRDSQIIILRSNGASHHTANLLSLIRKGNLW